MARLPSARRVREIPWEAVLGVAVQIAQQFITSHTFDTVLVIGAEKLTSITNWTDRNTCVLFGDGAGAAILRHRSSSDVHFHFLRWSGMAVAGHRRCFDQ